MTNRADALRSAFAGTGTARTDALRHIVLPVRPPAAPRLASDPSPDEGAAPSEDQPGEPQSTRPPTGPPGERSDTPAPAGGPPLDEETAATSRATIVYVTPPMREALRQQAAREPQVTFTDLVLDALEQHESELREAWSRPRPASGRFTRKTSRRARREEPGVQLALRLTRSNIAALDAMVTEVGAPSRTALVEEALRRYYSRSR